MYSTKIKHYYIYFPLMVSEDMKNLEKVIIINHDLK